MLALATHVGKQTAHKLVYDTAMNAQGTGQAFKEAALSNPRITAHLNAEDIEALCDYQLQTGQCGAMVDRVVSEQK